ncbi:MAG: FAD-dependent oxidoreductase [Gemmatimonadetes bacterium]|nr:FAD-dependent oxidoreductase [Gemmatimonadota bacterium]
MIPGTSANPLRVAVIGAGPAGFFLAEKLLGREDVTVHVDLYERLPTPHGLVRFGVAPDHEKIKNVTRQFDKIAARPGFRFFGNVEIGRQVTLDDLRRHYHEICFTTGAQTDRHMGIPGEDLQRSHAATEFVGWYNGHPDYRDRTFDLAVERVAVVGVGNVAVDVARMLCRTAEELATTDVADYALEALRASKVKEVHLLGRRGPVQAAFTNPEAKELGELPGADVCVLPEELELDPLSQAELELGEDHGAARKKLDILREFSQRPRTGKPRLLTVRFLVSPVELLPDDQGRVRAMRLVRNRLVAGKDGAPRAEPTGQFEQLPVELVFRSVGYRGVAIPGLPFDEKAGVVPNEKGRVSPGIYVAGWIKRGPTGVIGTNKPDAAETAAAMLEDAARGMSLEPPEPAAALEALVRRAQPAVVTYPDWQRLDQLETARGKALGRPRLKMTTVEEMIDKLKG